MPDQPVFVLDSFAVLAHLQDESGRGRVVTLLEDAARGECLVLLSLINLGEVAYLLERRRGLARTQAALAVVEALPVAVLPADRDAVLVAAHLKALYPISFADASAAAAAQMHQATLLTGDPEFNALGHQINVEWLERT